MRSCARSLAFTSVLRLPWLVAAVSCMQRTERANQQRERKQSRARERKHLRRTKHVGPFENDRSRRLMGICVEAATGEAKVSPRPRSKANYGRPRDQALRPCVAA